MSSLFAVIRQSLGIAAPASRKVAKERLSIMLVHQRNNDNITNLDMNLLQKELR
jgi:septum formation topological specificity factor MinE